METLTAVIVGLFGILPTGEVLLRKAVDEKDPHGHRIPRHDAEIRFKSGGKDKHIKLGGNKVNKVILGSGGAPKVGDFVKFSDLSSSSPVLDLKDDKLVARVELKGGDLLPVGISGIPGKYEPGAFRWRAVGKFSYTNNDTEKFKKSEIANGALWKLPVSVPPVLQIDGEPYTLDPDPTGAKYMVDIENVGHTHDEPGPAADRHFSLIYDFFFKPAPEIWVPVIQALPEGALPKGVDPATPPGSQCIPPRLE